jgi:NIMA (never in mitosis gene a)-related kinase
MKLSDLRNILINEGKLKLGDFGFSKQLDITSISAACTPIYASPEMIEKRFDSSVRVNKNTDIWSVGCVLFEMKTFQKAFDFWNMSTLRSQLNLHRPQDLIDNSSHSIRYLCDG